MGQVMHRAGVVERAAAAARAAASSRSSASAWLPCRRCTPEIPTHGSDAHQGKLAYGACKRV